MTFKVSNNGFELFKNAVRGGLHDAVVDFVGQLKENFVPRSDYWQTPLNPDSPVTGNLKDATTRTNDNDFSYRVGVDAGHPGEGRSKPVEYGEYLEFGTRKMQPRPFLRTGVEVMKERFQQVFKKGFKNRFK